MAKDTKLLDEVIDTSDDKNIYFIGGHEAFFWIGTGKQYAEEIDEVSQKMVDYMTNQVKRKKETIETLKQQIDTLEGHIKGFVPLRVRQVKAEYPSIDPFQKGYKILIKGKTAGKKYWLLEEYEQERRNNVKKRKKVRT